MFSISTSFYFYIFSVYLNVDHQHLPCGQGLCPSDHVCINVNGTSQCLDGCQRYTVLNDDWLSEYNVNGNSLCGGNSYSSDWYRMFLGQSSAQIPETCVQESRCSSLNRYWVRTSHPVRYNESVTLSASYARDSDCYYSYYSYNIMARLCYGDFYVYKLPRLPGCGYSYCPVPPHGFRSSGQNETSITLLWNPVNSSVSFVLQFNGTESNISAPAGSGPATNTISSLTPATKYTFTLFSVFGNVRSSGISIDAVTAPQNVEVFRVVTKTDRSVTLQWSKVNFASYVLQYNQGWKNISASDGDGPITYTVSSLSADTAYTFTLFSVFENAKSGGVQLQALTDQPYFPCGQTFCPPDQDCVIINGTAQCGEACKHYTELNDNWLSEYNINGNPYCNGNYYSPEGWYRMFVGQTSAQIPETCVQDSRCSYNRYQMTQPHPTQYNQTVTRSLCYSYGSSCCSYTYSYSIKVKLCYGDFYVYKLQTLPGCNTAYCAVPKHSFRAAGQDETSITLRWNKVNNSVSFVLLFNGTETNISAPAADDSVTYTVSSLTAATKYTFTLFSVFDNVTSSGISIDAFTAPPNPQTFSLLGTSFNSITLQWSKVNNASYVLEYNNGRKIIPASDGDGPVTYTVSSLSAGTSYYFSLYSVFENARGSEMQLQAVTDQYVSCGQTVCPPDQDCVIINGTAQCGEACEHYTELNDNWLSEYNINGNSYCSGSYYFAEGWYRMFVGQTSAQIPETCVQDSRCSSYGRYQMTQPHPTQYNQTVTRSLCQSYYGSCCSYTSDTIKVKLCFGDFYVYKLQRLPGCNTAYCAVPKHSFRAAGQDQTSISLRWNKVNNSVSFVLLFNGTETNISAPAADDSVTYTVSSLTAATKYTFTLFSVFDNVRSSGISIDAVTAPPNVKTFSLLGTSFNSITLQWSKVNNASYVLEYDNGRRIIPASDGDGPVTYTVSSLSAGTYYSFSLYSVFENARGSEMQLLAVTDDQYVSCGQTVCPPDQDCVIINGTAQCGEACEHYTELNDNWLSEYNINGNSYCRGSYSSPEGWYRMFVGQTSAQIPETCVQDSRCSSSYYHLQMTQPHPTQYNQTVTRSLCYSYGSSCCYYTSSYTIKVKLCYGDYYVYKLQRLPGCNTAYCAVPKHSFRAAGQDETSITLRWNQVNNSVSFVLLFNGTETNISAPAADDSVTYTVSSLTAATKYTFTLFSVFENVRSSGISIDAVTAPPNPQTFSLLGTSFNSITLQWSKVNNASYVLEYNNGRRIIPASDGDGPVTYTVSSLSAGTRYSFNLYSVFENAKGSEMQLQAVTDQYVSCGQTVCPPGQDCVIINGTAQCGEACEHYTELNDNWLSEYNINGNSYCSGSYYSTEGWYRMFVGQTSAQIPETCVQDSRCSSYNRYQMTQPHPTQYNQTVTRSLCYSYGSSCCYYTSDTIKVKLCYGDYYVYKLQRLPGCNIAYCAVPKHSFRAAGQDETSITLRWNKVNNSVSFVLLFNGTETNISAPAADDSVTYTVSSLTAATKYTFTLFSVFENVRSSGISIDAVTAPPNPKTFIFLGTSFNSITLQWSKVNNASYVLEYYYNGRRIIPASDGDGPVTYTVSSLSAGTRYSFNLYSVFENARSNPKYLDAFTDEQNILCGQTFCPPGQDCVIINGTAQCGEACQHYSELNDNWLSEYNINGNSYCSGNDSSPRGWYRMFVGQTSAQIPETCVQDSRCSSSYYHLQMTQPHPTQYNQTVTRTLCQSYGSSCCSYTSSYSIKVKLCYGDYYVYKLQRLPGCNTAYCAVPKHSFRAAGQDQTSITLRWNKVNNSVSFVLLFNGTETNISAPAADDSVTYTVSSLTAATKYTFTLFSVSENVRSSGISIDAFTAPPNAEIFSSIKKNDTSVTLQWSKAKYSGYFLDADYQDRIFVTSDADGPTVFTVFPLYPATKYTFTLFSVFENTRSSGVQLTVLTDHRHLPCGETFCAPDLNCFINNGSALCVDPCEHYTALSDWSPVNGCGGSIVPGGWYSFFLGQTRAHITETCKNTCGRSHFKLAEPHPTEYNQSVTLPVCYSYTGNCCDVYYPYFIKVKLCYGDFYVYKPFDQFSCYYPYCAVPNHSFRVSGQTETSITLQWDNVNNSNVSFILEFNGTETNISAPNGDGQIFYTISSLTAGTKYTFTIFSVFENVRGKATNMTAVTAPQNPQNIRQTTQNESSITLQWNKVNNVSFVLQLDGTETSITATDGDGPVTYTFSSLTAQTKYTVILFSVLENVRSSGQKLTVVTAPPNAKNCKASGQNESSITLQWDKVNTNVSFVLQFNGTETNISAPAGDAVIHHTVSSLTAGTKYTFTLFSVFENVRSTGVNITAATGMIFNFLICKL
ncbi:uncharacterized protein LOC101161675 isoform X1 [Oryzias latipes]